MSSNQQSLAELHDVWTLWSSGRPASAEPYVALSEQALNLGENLLAADMLRCGLAFFPTDLRLRQLQALALARSGAFADARRRLDELVVEGHRDEETLGALARTYKDLWLACDDQIERRGLLARAFEQYMLAFHECGTGTWSRINAATLALCLGRTEVAHQLAGDVAAECRVSLDRQKNRPTRDSSAYWTLATLGEAALVHGDLEVAGEWYRLAKTDAPGGWGSIASTRRNARLILSHRGDDVALLDQWLPMPRVVVFSGHMIDREQRESPRMPAEIEGPVGAEIRSRLDALDAGFGYSSAACGTDILFLEAMVERGGEITVVIPYGTERFVRDSVAVVSTGEWERRFRKLIDRKQTRLITASQWHMPGTLSYEYANQLLFGLAGIRAWQLETKLAPLAVWDGKTGDGTGGTGSAVALWRASGCEPSVIEPARFRASVPPSPDRPASIAASSDHSDFDAGLNGSSLPARVMAMLFADVVGFSKMAEEEIPLFVQHFLEPVAELCNGSKYAPVQRSTWGDGLHLVFNSVGDAGMFALELRDLLDKTDWKAAGFRQPLAMRTGLHVGPVFMCTNPVTNREDYVGTHVSRTARLEPITPPGQVYASEGFAALAFAQRASGFACEYVGRLGWDKKYGEFPTYLIRRAQQPILI